MKKAYSKLFTSPQQGTGVAMHCLWLAIVLVLFGSLGVQAQTPSYFNDNYTSGSNSFPLNTTSSNKVQWVYPPSYFNSNGQTGTPAPGAHNITDVYFKISTTNSTCTYTNFTVSLGQNVGTISNLTGSAFQTGLTQVFYAASHTVTDPPNITNAWFKVTLSTPFTYDPSLSILVELKVSGKTSGGYTLRHNYGSGSGKRRYGGYASATGTVNTGETPFGFDMVPNVACSGTPAPGATTSDATGALCPSESVLLGITNVQGAGTTYQWQKSTVAAGGPYTNISGATNASLSTSQTATSWYRCAVTCTNSSLSANSTPVQVLSAGSPLAGTYTINALAGTSWPSGTNFNNFADAADALACVGVSAATTFNLTGSWATYAQQVEFGPIVGASAVNTVTFNCNNKALQFAGSSTNRAVLLMNGADYVTFNDLTVTNTSSSYGTSLWMTNNSDNNNFNDCVFNSSTTTTTTSSNMTNVVMSASATAITTSGTQSGNDNTFDDCVINGGSYNMYVYGRSTTPYTNGNKFIDCEIKNFYYRSMYLYYQDDVLFKNCDFHRSDRTVVYTSTTYWVYWGLGNSNVFDGNKFHNPNGLDNTPSSTMYGIYVFGDGTSFLNSNKIINNIFYDWDKTSTSSQSQYMVYASAANYLDIFHNTFVMDGAGGSSTQATRGIYEPSGGSGTRYKNNIFYLTRNGPSGTSSNKVCFYVDNIPAADMSNNVCYTDHPTIVGYAGGYLYKTTFLSTSWGTNSFLDDPQFTSIGGDNYEPTNGTINGGGIGVGVPVDHFNASRSATTPDPGAIEFDIVGTDAGISWVSPSSPATTGLKTITVNISNNATATIQTVTLSYNDGGTPVTQVFSGLNLLGGNNVNLSFTTPYNLTSTTTLTANIQSTGPGIDNNPLNNSVSETICIGLAGVYTINSAAATGGTNYNDFGDAVAALTCGIAGPVTFNVLPAGGTGVYNEQVSIPQIDGASAVNTITFNGNGNTLQFSATSSLAPHTLLLGGADYTTWNDLVVKGNGTTYGLVCHLWNGSNNNTFNDCEFSLPITSSGSSSYYVPYSISGSATSAGTSGTPLSNDNVVNNCDIIGGYYAVVMRGASTSVLHDGNKLIGNDIRDFYVYGIYNYYNSGTVIQNNIIHRPNRTTVSTFYGSLNYYTRAITIEGNRVVDPAGSSSTNFTGYGIVVYYNNYAYGSTGPRSLVANNLVAGFQNNGTKYGIYIYYSGHIDVLHNTVAMNDASTASGTVYGLYWYMNSTSTTYSSSGTVMRNNISFITQNTSGSSYGVRAYASSSSVWPRLTCDNNNVYLAGSGTKYYGGRYTTNYLTLANWQAGTVWGDNSGTNDPDFDNPAALSYLPYSIPMANIGANQLALVSNDIVDEPRDATPTPGAWEAQLHPVNLGVTQLVNPVTGDCMSSTQNIVVELKNYGTAVMNFAVTPAAVSGTVYNGVTTTNVSNTLTSGTLAVGATMNVNLFPTVNMGTNGSYTINATVAVTGDGQLSNNPMPETVVIRNTAPGTIANSGQLNHCYSAPPQVFTSTGQTGVDIQWQESTAGASGPWTNVGANADTYAPAAMSVNTWYRAVYSCDGVSANSNTIAIAINNPTLTSANGGTRCGPGQVVLSASAPSGLDIKWYDSQTATAELASGPTFQPFIYGTTSYWVGAQSGGGGPSSVSTPFNSNNGQSGNMFDVVATNSVTVTGVSINMDAVTAPVAVYYKAGSHVGFETNSAAWTLAGTSAPVTGAGLNVTTAVPLTLSIPVAAGNTVAFYVTLTSSTGINYTNGTAVGAPWANDANISILQGVGKSLPVFGSTFTVRNWNGILHYTAGCEGARQQVTATVTPAPATVAASSAEATVCDGNSTTVEATLTGTGSYFFDWYLDEIGGTYLAGGTGPISVSPTVPSNKYVVYGVDLSNNCAVYDEVTVAAVVNSASVTASTSATDFCPGGNTILDAQASWPGATCSAEQAPLPNQSGGFTGSVRGYYFTAPTSFVITNIRPHPNVNPSGNVDIAVVRFTSGAPGNFPSTTNAFTLLYSNYAANVGTNWIPVNIPVTAGDIIGIYGQRGDQTPYSTPSGAYTSSIGGFPATFTRSGMQANLGATIPMANIWAEPAGTIGNLQFEYEANCDFCEPQYSAACQFGDYIANVTYAGINNSTACTNIDGPGYNVYAGPNPTVNAGVSVPMSVTVGPSYSQGISVWIDYNQNNEYVASENVYHSFVATPGHTYNFNVTIPASAFNGQTRMRVRCAYNTDPFLGVDAPCGNFTYGETEDYNILVTGGTPNPNAFTYAWTGFGLNDPSLQSPTASSLLVSQTYSVTVTHSGTGCTASDEVPVNVYPPALPDATSDAPICDNSTLSLSSQDLGVTAGPQIVNGFQNDWAPGTWVHTNFPFNYTFGINGSVVTTGAPASIQVVGNDNNGFQESRYSHSVLYNGTISFDWSYTTADGAPNFDQARYSLDGSTWIDLPGWTPSGSLTQTGTASLTVAMGDLFGVEIYSIDGTGGAASVTLSNFIYHPDGAAQAPSTFQWTGPAGSGFTSSQQNPTIPNATIAGNYSGIYTVVATNSFGCTAAGTHNALINELPVPFITTKFNETCFNASDGYVDLGSSGPAPFQYQISPGGGFEINFFGDSVRFDGLSAGPPAFGFYSVDVTDGNNCHSDPDLQFQIFFIDTVYPTLNCPGNITMNNDPGMCGAIVGAAEGYVTPVGTDNCPGTNTIQLSGLPSGSFFPVGTTAVSYQATDFVGNVTTCSFLVTIEDNEDPVVTNACPTNFSACNPVTWTEPVFGDNCAAGLVVTASHTPPFNFASGTTTVTYTAVDDAGNTTICEFDVTLLEPSVEADSVTSNRDFNNICIGQNITIESHGGILGEGAQWVWYAGGCGVGAPIATGVTSLTLTPGVTTTYYVRAEGVCNITTCQAITVTVSTAPPNGQLTVSGAPAVAAPNSTHTLTASVPPTGVTRYRWTTNQPNSGNLLFDGNPQPYETSSPSVDVSFLGAQQNYVFHVRAINACGQSNMANVRVRGTVAAPANIQGAVVACANTSEQYTSAAIANTTGYFWTLTPVGAGTIVGNGNQTITVNFAAGFTSAVLCCNGETTFGLAGPQTCITIDNVTATPGPVSGETEPCQGATETYTIAAVTGATSYNWTSTVAGASIVNNGTSADVTYPVGTFSGQVCVIAISSCGTSSSGSCLSVTSGSLPAIGSISGPVSGICGATSVNYQLPTSGADNGYTWTVPAGASVVSGAGTNSVNVNFTTTFGGGIIQVVAHYDCGDVTETLSVTGAPATPTVTPLTLCANTSELYIASSSGADSYSWTVGFGGNVFYTNAPVNNEHGIQWGSFGNNFSVTADNTCGSSAPFALGQNCRITGTASLVDALNATIYPNPTDGRLTVEFTSASNETFVLEVTDFTGRSIRTDEIHALEGLNQYEMDMSTVAKGMYLFNLQNQAGERIVIRVGVE